MTRKLILHFDLNETILVTDPAGGDSFSDCLNKAICKNVFVRNSGDLNHWENGSINKPNLNTVWKWPEGCIPCYRVPHHKKHSKTFTEDGKPGRNLRPLYDDMLQNLQLSEEELSKADERLVLNGNNFMLPAFFQTIHTLLENGRDFRIVIRTFGHDIEDVRKAFNAYVEGGHPNSAFRLTPEQRGMLFCIFDMKRLLYISILNSKIELFQPASFHLFYSMLHM